MIKIRLFVLAALSFALSTWAPVVQAGQVTFVCPLWYSWQANGVNAPAIAGYLANRGSCVLHGGGGAADGCAPWPNQPYNRYACSGVCADGTPVVGGVTGGPAGGQYGTSIGPGYEICAAYYNDWEGGPLTENRSNAPTCDKCGNPVLAMTGTKYQSETDIASTGDGSLEFTRTYNSRFMMAQTVAGHYWHHTWSRRLVENGIGQRVALRSDGTGFIFNLQNGLWVGSVDAAEKLEAIATGFRLTTTSEDVEEYDTVGRLRLVKLKSGRTYTLDYSDGTGSGPYGAKFLGTTINLQAGLLLRVTDFRGRSLKFDYATSGNLARVTDAAGNMYSYAYSADDRYLTSVTYPNASTRTYLYGEAAYASSAWLLTGIVDENGKRFATYKYQSDRKAVSTEHAGGVNKYTFTYTYGALGTTVVTPLGATLTMGGALIQGVAQLSTVTQNCPGCGGTSTSTYTFDANRNLTSIKDYNGNLTCKTWDTARILETSRTEGLSGTGTCAAPVTTPVTRKITTEWQSSARLVKRQAEPLRITSFTYHGLDGASCAPAGVTAPLVCSKSVQATTDATGTLGFAATLNGAARTTSYTYNSAGSALTVDGPRTDVSDVTTMTYYTVDDGGVNYRVGDLATVTNAAGHTTSYLAYDGNGRPKVVSDPNGLVTQYDYWPRGWLKTRSTGTAGDLLVTQYDYDNVGQLKKVTAPDGSFVAYTYDDAHRLTEVADGLGNRIVYTLDNMGNRTAENSYDPGNVLAKTMTRVIDVLNRVQKEIGGTNPATQIVQYGYDNNGNRTTTTDPFSRVTTQVFDALNRVKEIRDPFNGVAAPTRFEYNGLDQLTKVTDPNALDTLYAIDGHGDTTQLTSPDTSVTTSTFDAASNLKTKLDARGVLASYSYDALNRITQIVYPDETVVYTYDSCTFGVGRLCSISDKTGSTVVTYDRWGRVTSKSHVIGAVTRTMGYEYNLQGNLSKVTYPSGRQVVYGYANGRPTSVSVDGQVVLDSVVYLPFGPITSWRWGNSTVGSPNFHTRTHDKDYRLSRVKSDRPTSGAQPLFDRGIGWDKGSRVESITDYANAAFNGAYGYDALDRLTSATVGASTWGYSYNGTGDRLTSTNSGATTNYGYTPGTHKIASLSGAQTKSFTLDAAGNTTSDGALTWTYGGNNRPTQAGTTAFAINALGQRVKKAAGVATLLFAYDEAGHLAGEYNGTGTAIQETIWLGDLPVAVVNAAINYIHTDQLGTPRVITASASDAIQWRWDNTEPFGVGTESAIGLSFGQRFPGQYFDSETGKHYNYFRTYDPAIGRYISSDPLGLRAGLSTYSYVSSRPLSRIDPLGLKSRVCCKNIPILMTLGSDVRHCYIETVNSNRTTYGLQGPPVTDGYGYTFQNNSFDFEGGGACGDWNDGCGTDDCVDKSARDYPNPTQYGGLSSNSNTFAGNIARSCGLRRPVGDFPTPGWNDAAAPPAVGIGPLRFNSPVPPFRNQNPFSSGGG